jgi:uncharacterized protein (DUF1330 family)
MKAWVIFERIAERNLDFVPEYRKVAAASVARFGGRYRTVSFSNPIVEGPAIGEGPRMISVIEFDSREKAEAWFHSPEYAEAIVLRKAGVTNRTMIIDVSPPAYAAEAGAV